MALKKFRVRETARRQTKVRRTFQWLILFATVLLSGTAHADDGYRLWLRYDPVPKSASDGYLKQLSSITVAGDSATCDAIRSELINGLSGLLGRTPSINAGTDPSSLVIGTPSSSTFIGRLPLSRQLVELGPEGYVIRSIRSGSQPTIVIASQSDVGALYGTFHFLRLMQTLQSIENINVSDKPRLRLRVLDHWDNLDGSIER